MTMHQNQTKIETANHGVPWEKAFGYAQAVRVKDTIYISGQLSHDASGNLVAPAKVDAAGKPESFENMDQQIRQTYENARILLERFGASFDDVVEETLYVLDVDAAFGPAAAIRKAVYGSDVPQVASNIIGVNRLAFPQQLVEVAFRAVVDR
ncbi:Rid family hydrolase [Pararhizobium arenae]|uniref:Rid family hydrolase n=1 Tax=Pararhizobium arenae TaxID=1856850 RepID=UPI00094ACAF7|nr:Rid family hydrolase [Pararhizobium arenae]